MHLGIQSRCHRTKFCVVTLALRRLLELTLSILGYLVFSEHVPELELSGGSYNCNLVLCVENFLDVSVPIIYAQFFFSQPYRRYP